MASGNITGGVCEDCQHNTVGPHCERCKPYFYRDPQRTLDDTYVCQPCDCDPNGSEEQGLCDSETDAELGLQAGQCHCKANVQGKRCDSCKSGFWRLEADNREGCQGKHSG